MKNILDKINKADKIQASKVELGKHEVELALISEISDSVRKINLQKIVEPVKTAADKSYSLLLEESKKLPIIQEQIANAKTTLKSLGLENKDLDSSQKLLDFKNNELKNLLKGINNARNIETNI
jgi:hypothetical protein